MNIALLLSGGTGTRLGAEIPKQYLKAKDKMIITYCLETLFASAKIDIVWVVADSNWQDDIILELKKFGLKHSRLKGFSLPGANRQMSIYNGLTDVMKLAPEGSAVMIHDAARPLLTEELINRCFDSIGCHDGVMPVLPMKDTVYMSSDGKSVSELLDRQSIFAGQAPEVFDLYRYYQACYELLPDKIMMINGSTEPAILAGMNIAMVPGDEGNFKITTKEDLNRFLDIIDKQEMENR